MHEAVYLVNPIIEVWVICRIWVIIGRLPRMSRETIRSMLSTWNLNEGEVEEEYEYDPAIDTGRWGKVRIQ